MLSEVFLDSSYAIALSSYKDALHDAAVGLASRIRAEQRRFVTTRAVLVEIGNGLAKLQLRQGAAKLLKSIEKDSSFTIVSSTDDLYAEALLFYERRPDKEWGMTDCMSFVVMEKRGIIEALTHDVHFQQAGFRALLREATST